LKVKPFLLLLRSLLIKKSSFLSSLCRAMSGYPPTSHLTPPAEPILRRAKVTATAEETILRTDHHQPPLLMAHPSPNLHPTAHRLRLHHRTLRETSTRQRRSLSVVTEPHHRLRLTALLLPVRYSLVTEVTE